MKRLPEDLRELESYIRKRFGGGRYKIVKKDERTGRFILEAPLWEGEL